MKFPSIVLGANHTIFERKWNGHIARGQGPTCAVGGNYRRHVIYYVLKRHLARYVTPFLILP